MPLRGAHRARVALLATAVAGMILTAVATASGAEDTARGVVVGMGDSYGAGLGAGDTDPGSGDCRRSAHAWQAGVSLTNPPASAVVQAACSGATTLDVRSPAQMAALSGDTRLVMLSVGGNDAFFGQVLATCATTPNCGDRALTGPDGAELLGAPISRTLPEHIATVVAQRMVDTLTDIAGKAPNATIVWLGYPDPLGDPDGTTIDATCLNVRAELTHLADPDTRRLAITIGRALEDAQQVAAEVAAQAGVNVRFVSTKETFSGHSACRARRAATDPSGRWITGVSFTDPTASFHPNVHGQRAYQQVAQAVVDSLGAPSIPIGSPASDNTSNSSAGGGTCAVDVTSRGVAVTVRVTGEGSVECSSQFPPD